MAFCLANHGEMFLVTGSIDKVKGPVEAAMKEGRDTLFDIDWQGGQQIRNSSLGRDVVSIFVLPPSFEILERRLRGRSPRGKRLHASAPCGRWPSGQTARRSRPLQLRARRCGPRPIRR